MKKWINQDLKWLKENYKNKNYKECAVFLNRSKSSITSKMNKLNLSLKIKIWTEDNIHWLKENYNLKGAPYCAKFLNISPHAIHNKVRKLHLKCNKSQCYRQERNSRWTGYKQIHGSFFQRIKKNARIRNLDFNITIEQIWDLFLKQDKKCAFSGLNLSFDAYCQKGDGDASLDRIDSSKGYTIDNVQWIHKKIQPMKMAMTDQEFIEWINQIYQFQHLEIAKDYSI